MFKQDGQIFQLSPLLCGIHCHQQQTFRLRLVRSIKSVDFSSYLIREYLTDLTMFLLCFTTVFTSKLLSYCVYIFIWSAVNVQCEHGCPAQCTDCLTLNCDKQIIMTTTMVVVMIKLTKSLALALALQVKFILASAATERHCSGSK